MLTSETYTLSLHDALPIWALGRPLEDHLLLSPEGDLRHVLEPVAADGASQPIAPEIRVGVAAAVAARSEEHTSELQSRGHIVCRLLLEKKNDILCSF